MIELRRAGVDVGVRPGARVRKRFVAGAFSSPARGSGPDAARVAPSATLRAWGAVPSRAC